MYYTVQNLKDKYNHYLDVFHIFSNINWFFISLSQFKYTNNKFSNFFEEHTINSDSDLQMQLQEYIHDYDVQYISPTNLKTYLSYYCRVFHTQSASGKLQNINCQNVLNKN